MPAGEERGTAAAPDGPDRRARGRKRPEPGEAEPGGGGGDEAADGEPSDA